MRTWLVPYTRDWSYDHTARGVTPYLRGDVRVAYSEDVASGALSRWEADVVVDLWWKGVLHWGAGRRTLRQVSSHRWNSAISHSLGPNVTRQQLVEGVGAIAVPSVRLVDVFSPVSPHVHLCPKGFDPTALWSYGRRRASGELRVCWAGDASQRDKRVGEIECAWPNVSLADKCLTRGEMCDFYNGADVLAVASVAEGDPRTLIEGMACGLFPVCTDVGIVPELVTHGVNGLIVQSVKDLRDAFAWCAANRRLVRDGGEDNARRMLDQRTWAHVAPAWQTAIDDVLRRSTCPDVGQATGF